MPAQENTIKQRQAIVGAISASIESVKGLVSTLYKELLETSENKKNLVKGYD